MAAAGRMRVPAAPGRERSKFAELVWKGAEGTPHDLSTSDGRVIRRAAPYRCRSARAGAGGRRMISVDRDLIRATRRCLSGALENTGPHHGAHAHEVRRRKPAFLRNYWYVAASDQRSRSARSAGHPGRAGRLLPPRGWHAGRAEDRCAHRHLPLPWGSSSTTRCSITTGCAMTAPAPA
jgi:hypothetical protein